MSIQKIVNAATDEILCNIKYCIKEGEEYACGGYHINNKYHLFGETVLERMWYDDEDVHTGFIVKIEVYDENEDCIDVDYDNEYADTIEEEDVKGAIRKLLERNPEVFETT